MRTDLLQLGRFLVDVLFLSPHFTSDWFIVFTGNEACNFFVNGTKYSSKRADTRDSSKRLVEIKKPAFDVSALIGSINTGGGRPLDATMDELSIFNKTLTEEEIQELMNKTCKRFSSSRKYRRIYIRDFTGAEN